MADEFLQGRGRQALNVHAGLLAEMGELLYQLGSAVGIVAVELPGAAGGADNR